ncbi:pyroglutamyl-peptidase I [Brevibacillus sp. H7]|uniref:pyroglutamyl-peptidase I n=1 Tax=Brevibacillus sp. H7 TaxID=3349138 RepID=UPI003802E52E
MKILVSGFEPFSNYPVNPTGELIASLAGFALEGVEIITVLLPVNYDECVELIVEQMDRHRPDVVICNGLYAGRTTISVERVAINIKDTVAEEPIPDNKGRKPRDEKIDPHGPDGLFATLPVRAIVNRLLEQHIPATISNTAGTYICNNTMYGVLRYIQQKQLSAWAGFIHYPASTRMSIWNPTWPSMEQEKMNMALQLAIETIVSEWKTYYSREVTVR